MVLMSIYSLYMFAFYSVKTTNLLYNTSSIAHNQFRADLKIVPYLMLVLTNSLATWLRAMGMTSTGSGKAPMAVSPIRAVETPNPM